MRRLSDLEVEVVKRLVSHSDLTEQGLVQFASVLDGEYVGPTTDVSIFGLADNSRIGISVRNTGRSEAGRIFVRTLEVMNLFRMLEAEGLILFLDSGESQGDFQLGGQHNEGHTIWAPNPLARFAYLNLNRFVMVTQGLRSYVSNGCRTEEELRYSRTLKTSVAALVVAVLLGLYGIWGDRSNQHTIESWHTDVLRQIRGSATSVAEILEETHSKMPTSIECNCKPVKDVSGESVEE